MPCKKSELVSAINSFGAARASGDMNLINMAAELLASLVDTLEFSPEEQKETVEAAETEQE